MANPAVPGLGKIEIFLVVGFILFLIVLIISGRILNEINKSSCKSDSNIKDAHKWAAWTVGISVVGVFITLVVLILLFMK
jgi:uncharacterized BrkB/YihY/UPF0761 family membrane protein